MKILYGIITDLVDVTKICCTYMQKDGLITIPDCDVLRSRYFGDHIPNVLKSIYINDVEYNHNTILKIDINTGVINVQYIENINIINQGMILRDESVLKNIHNTINIKYGSMKDEYPEQLMSVRFISKDAKVLEIGGNIGRNSVVIASLLIDQKNLLVLESDVTISKQLIENRDINDLHFLIEDSALSKRKLIQKGWETIPCDEDKIGYNNVKIIDIETLRNKYNISFDTLVLDCEGAFYYILQDMPEILDNIKTIIMENDYHNIEHKNYIDNKLKKSGFIIIYSESGGWGPCRNRFFETWHKN